MAIFVLGGTQTDFSRNMSRENRSIFQLMGEVVNAGLDRARVPASDIQVAHIGNFVGELFCHQAQLGGLFASIRPEFHGIPTSRHEAACASGSVAAMAAMADLEAGYYDVACVVGAEIQRNQPGEVAARHLGVAAWTGHEAQGARYAWPYLFNRFVEVYEERFGIDHKHLAEIARINFGNAKRNPNAQTRNWTLTDAHFTEDAEVNPIVEGTLRRHDCSQITDGGAVVVLATERYATEYAKRTGTDLNKLPRIRGWGHRTAPMGFDEKLEAAKAAASPWVLPHMRLAFEDAWRRAGVSGIDAIDAVELHDCFTITEYMTLEHLGLAPVGQAWRAIESGRIRDGGKTPVNPSGGLMGGGHPIGASGVRMLLDAYKQVMGQAGDYQVPNARTVQTVNIGGSGTTTLSFIVGAN